MGRMVFKKGEFTNFILKTKDTLGLSWDKLGKRTGVTGRTLRDWKRGVLLPSEQKVKKLEKLSGVKAPKPIEVRKEFWSGGVYGRAAAIARMKKYGPPGTTEGRRKGGMTSQKRRKEDPEYYRKLGCLVRKKFLKVKPSAQLAELTGIILGDGGISNYQLRIYLNRKADQVFAQYVSKLLKTVFGEAGSRYEHPEENLIILNITGVDLIEQLSKWGLEKGNKVKRQIDFPEWINRSSKYKKLCVRGLVDTDGCLFFHHHWTTSRGVKYKYRNLGLCFTSASRKLINSVSKTLDGFCVKHSINHRGDRIFIYNLEMVKRYLKVFGSSNPRISDKLKYHISCSTRLN